MSRKAMRIRRAVSAVIALLLMMSMATPAMAETFSAIVTTDSMTVYRDAGLSAKLGSVEKNTVVRVIAYSGRAARITYGGETGYAKVSDMKSVDSVATKVITARTAKVYQTPSETDLSAKVSAGTRLYVLATKDEWSMVEKDGVVGYMFARDLVEVDDDWQRIDPDATPTPTPTPTSAPNMIVKTFDARATESVAVYSAPNTASRRLGTLKKGQTVTVGAYSDDGWAYISLSGHYGYCQYESLVPVGATPTPAPTATINPADVDQATVSAAKLAVYKAPDANSTKLGTLKQGQVVNVLDWGDPWTYIELNGNTGYCATNGLSGANAPTPTPTPTPTPSIENAAKATVTAASLSVYQTASTNAAKLGTLKKGQVVNVLSWNDSWAWIELNGRYGFCATVGLAKEASPTAAPTPTPSTANAVKAIALENTKVYRLAGDASTILGVLKKDVEVNVLSISDGWAWIELKGHYGFCAASSLTKADSGNMPADFHKATFAATVIYPGARSYATPSTSAQSASLALGATVNVVGYNEQWACINRDGSRVYVPVKHLSRASYDVINDDGADLLTLLKALLSYGYFDGVPSETFNTAAVTAIRRFQSACGLSETGVADQPLQRILYGGYAPSSSMITSAVTSGSSSASVKRLQTRLYALGFLSKTGSIDGDYGSTTQSAVSQFQSVNGLTETGTADVATLKKMYSTGAVSKPSSMKAADAVTIVNPTSTVTLSSTYVTTMPAALKSTTSSVSASSTKAEKLEYVIYRAQQKLGCTYVYGSTGPNTFDCSGLTTYAFKEIGVSLYRTAYSQGYDTSYTKIESVSSLRRGDLVFFNTISDSDLCDHVGIYLGGGCFIHASSGGGKVVVSNLTSGYYNRVFSWGRRIL